MPGWPRRPPVWVDVPDSGADGPDKPEVGVDALHVPRRGTAGPLQRTVAVWRKRGVVALLVRRDLKVRYADSVLGYLWTVLDPLLMALIYWFVFQAIFRRSVGEDPYILYLLAGMLPFHGWLQSSLTASVRAIKGERLVRSTAMPREVWVLRVVLSKAMEYVFSLPVLVAFAVIYQKSVGWEILLMIPAMLLQFMLLTGAGLLLAALGTLARDVDRVIGIVTRLLFYGTPIIYGLNDVLSSPRIPEFVGVLYAINPVTGIVSLYRAGFFPDELHGGIILSSVIGSVVMFIVGWWVFIRLESTVLKEI